MGRIVNELYNRNIVKAIVQDYAVGFRKGTTRVKQTDLSVHQVRYGARFEVKLMVWDKTVLRILSRANILCIQAHARVTWHLWAVHTGVWCAWLVAEPASRSPQDYSLTAASFWCCQGNRFAWKQLSGHEGFLHHLRVSMRVGMRVWVGQREGVWMEMGVGVCIRVDRELLLHRNVSIQGPWRFGMVVLEAAARRGVHIVTGRTEDHVTPLAGGHGGAAQPTALTLHATMSFEQPCLPCIPRLSRWRSRGDLPPSHPGAPLSVQVDFIQGRQVVGGVRISWGRWLNGGEIRNRAIGRWTCHWE